MCVLIIGEASNDEKELKQNTKNDVFWGVCWY